ncbi:hypothetical protein [Microlunatus panaciterrae]|uniref:hypothetical protein n=1 Tax=Microlunatus panaciterrae TaxID=400768 RepID=UPI00195B585C|nr:hypothetical protein [Microlunatus panaciterrae]
MATTQASINATMKTFLANLTEPVVSICYIADDAGNPTQIDYDDLVQSANGTDPFAVPADADPDTSQDLKNLIAARFMMGFRAQLGLPPGIPPAQMPDLVCLGADTSVVGFNLLCAEFTVVDLDPGSGYTKPSWMNQCQPAGAPWIFSSKVDLRLSTTDSSAYSTLPPDVRQEIGNLGGQAFSVQQLLFDLDNAALESLPTISGVAPGTKLYSVLQQEFLGAYFSALAKEGAPVLGCTITHGSPPAATLTLSDLNLEVSPFLGSNGQPVAQPTQDQQNLATLNYLCAADGNTLPPAVAFGWNWIDPSEEADYDGVVAINRTSLAGYFRNQLQYSAAANSFLAWVRVWLSGFLDATTNFSWRLTADQTPTVTTPPTGPVILTFHYDSDAEDAAGLDDDMGKLELKPSYDLTVSVSGSTITIVQHLVVYLYVRVMQTSGDGNVVDRTITDTYALSVGEHGELATTLASTTSDNSQNPSTNGFLNFFTDLNRIIDDVSGWVRNFTATNLTDIPASLVQNYVFPGGATFAFKSVAFSDNQDLVSHITYSDPS